MVKSIARTPADDERPITPVVIKRVLVERIGPKPADAPEDMPSAKNP